MCSKYEAIMSVSEITYRATLSMFNFYVQAKKYFYFFDQIQYLSLNILH